MEKFIVELTKEEMQRCISFSKKSAESQQPIEFGQHDTIPRGVAEIARDNLIQHGNGGSRVMRACPRTRTSSSLLTKPR